MTVSTMQALDERLRNLLFMSLCGGPHKLIYAELPIMGSSPPDCCRALESRQARRPAKLQADGLVERIGYGDRFALDVALRERRGAERERQKRRRRQA